MRGNKKLITTLFSITGVVIIAKLLGFIKQIITAQTFGATIDTDLISLSEGFISNAEYAIVQTLTTAFVATYIHLSASNKKNADKFVSDSIKFIAFISCTIAVVIVFASPVVSKILAPSYDSELSGRLAVYIRIFAPIFVLVVMRSLFQALLNANDKYISGEMTAFNQSIVIIIVILSIASFYGVNTLVIASYASCIVNLFYLGFCARRFLILQRGNPFKSTEIRSMAKMMLPLLIGYSMIFINQQVDKIIVSGLEAGTVTAMHYGQVLSNLVCALITSFCTVMFTRLTQHISEGRNEQAASLSIRASILFVVGLVPVSVITVMCSNDIVGIAFGRGAFDNSAVEKASFALMGYGIMFSFYAIKSIFSRFQYGNKDTKTPMINNSIGICVNIVLSIILSRRLGVFGVTTASSVAELISAVLNVRSAKKSNSHIRLSKGYMPFVLIIAIGMIVSIVCCQFLNMVFVDKGRLLRFVFVSMITLVVYGAIIVIPVYRLIKKK